MLKEKNLVEAMEIVEKEGVDVTMSLEDVAKLHTEMEIAERAYDEQADLVKKHNNEVYAPMCAKKKELEVKMHVLRIKFQKVVAKNPSFEALIKLARKQAAKKGK